MACGWFLLVLVCVVVGCGGCVSISTPTAFHVFSWCSFQATCHFHISVQTTVSLFDFSSPHTYHHTCLLSVPRRSGFSADTFCISVPSLTTLQFEPTLSHCTPGLSPTALCVWLGGWPMTALARRHLWQLLSHGVSGREAELSSDGWLTVFD